MNAIYLTRRGGPEVLTYGSAAAPRPPGPGEVRVRVRAAAVTPTELQWAPTWTMQSGRPRPFPIIPGHEFSGEVDATGHGVSEVSIGDTVFGINDWFANGAQAELCLARVSDVAKKPASIDHATAATVPISALTAWQGVVERAALACGDRILIHGAPVGLDYSRCSWRGGSARTSSRRRRNTTSSSRAAWGPMR